MKHFLITFFLLSLLNCKSRITTSSPQDTIVRDEKTGHVYFIYEDHEDIVWIWRCNDHIKVASLKDLEVGCPDNDEKGIRVARYTHKLLVQQTLINLRVK